MTVSQRMHFLADSLEEDEHVDTLHAYADLVAQMEERIKALETEEPADG